MNYSINYKSFVGALSWVMVGKLDKQTYTSEFESHKVPPSDSLVPHLSKKLSKLQLIIICLHEVVWLQAVII